MATYTLYCFAQSGNAYKAALMLRLCGADWEPKFVDYFGGETRTAEYRSKINEMGEVPVLFDGNLKMSQTGVILTHLADKLGAYAPTDDEGRREALRWILFDNHKFTSYLATYRFLHAFANEADPAVMKFFRGRVDGALGIVAKHLDTQAFMLGPTPTIADISLCGYLFFPPDEFGFDIAADHPSIGRWLARIRSLPLWVHPYELMPGHPLSAR